MMRTTMVAVAAMLALSGCDTGPAVLDVDGAYVRLNANPAAPAGGYFTMKGGATADRLIAVSSEAVIKIEMHDSMTGAGGMMSMKPITGGVEVPVRTTVAFKEGGRHLMLFNVNPGIKPPRSLPLTFTFASGTALLVDAKVVAPGTVKE